MYVAKNIVFQYFSMKLSCPFKLPVMEIQLEITYIFYPFHILY